MKFNEMKMSDDIKKTLESIGYIEPTKVQSLAIPPALEGKDVVAQAHTGTGKTAAFAIPLIENSDFESKTIQHIILVPTRELATQVVDEILKLGDHVKIKVTKIIGGISYDKQRDSLKRNPQIVVATPGRLKDYIENKKVRIDLSNIKTFVLDEVDQLLGIGFKKDILDIFKNMPENKQSLFFSATFDKKVKDLADKILKRPVKVAASEGLTTTKNVEQQWIMTQQGKKLDLLKTFLKMNSSKGAIVFCRTKRDVDNVSEQLRRAGLSVDGIQGDMDQRLRSRVMKKFRDGHIKAIVGTEVLSRGIDVDHADYVYNYDLPEEISNYTHRIGRVGRAGRKGLALTFVTQQQFGYWRKIMKETKSEVTEIKPPTETQVRLIEEEQFFDELSYRLAKAKPSHKIEKIVESYEAEDMAKIILSLMEKVSRR